VLFVRPLAACVGVEVREGNTITEGLVVGADVGVVLPLCCGLVLEVVVCCGLVLLLDPAKISYTAKAATAIPPMIKIVLPSIPKLLAMLITSTESSRGL